LATEPPHFGGLTLFPRISSVQPSGAIKKSLETFARIDNGISAPSTPQSDHVERESLYRVQFWRGRGCTCVVGTECGRGIKGVLSIQRCEAECEAIITENHCKMIRSPLLLFCVTLVGAQSNSTQNGNYSQYGGSPPVYPSRKLATRHSFCMKTNLVSQQISRVLEVGKQH
jgi:hypothetical protein